MSLTAEQPRTLDAMRIRKAFPIFSADPSLVYLDNGATTQKPQAVIDAVQRFYAEQNSNIHRGVYKLSQNATGAYEQARRSVAKFINAPDSASVIFTRGTTESINLVATSFSRAFIQPGDEIIISALEHHSNIVPWQMACEQFGATLRVIPIDDAGDLRFDEFQKILLPRTRLVAITHTSNALGTVNDVRRVAEMAHRVGAKVLIDGAQWVAHHPTDVQAYDCDFYVFSSHKLFGPTGLGVLWGRRELLDAMPPYQGGGDMIESVSFEKTTYAALPSKFEAGTPHIAGAIGLAAAIEFVDSVGFDAIEAHEAELIRYAVAQLDTVNGLRIIGRPQTRSSVISFVVDNPPISTLDLGVALDRKNIAIRTGHHCCQPLMNRFSISSTARASLSMYNTKDDVDALVSALHETIAAHRPARAGSQSVAPSPEELSSGQTAPLIFPQPVTATPAAAAIGLESVFTFLESRDERSAEVIALGEKLPHVFDKLKVLTQRIPGCMSEVYLLARAVPGQPERIEFVADANADIVRGLIAILTQLFSGHRAADVLAFDVEAFFTRIGLDQFISSQRRNGLAGMIRRIHADARNILEAAHGK